MIEIDNVTKRDGTTVAVDRLSFEVREGEVTGFLGPNGAGKSTTMRMVVGLDLPTIEVASPWASITVATSTPVPTASPIAHSSQRFRIL